MWRKSILDKIQKILHTVYGRSNKVQSLIAVAQTYLCISGMYHCIGIRPKRYLSVGGQSYHDTTHRMKAAREITIMKKFWLKVWKWICKPFIWIWQNLKDPVTAIIFAIVFVVLSSEVWVPYLVGFIIPSTRAYLWSIGSACWLFWLGPGTPFLPLCMAITVGIKALVNRIRK